MTIVLSSSNQIKSDFTHKCPCPTHVLVWNHAPTFDIIQSFYPRMSLSLSPIPYASPIPGPIPSILHCPFSWRLWSGLLQLINHFAPVPGSLVDFFSSWRMAHFDRTSTRLWDCVCTPLFGLFGRSITIASLIILLGICLLFKIPFCFSLANRARKDCIFLNYSFESWHCNLRFILLSHENNLIFYY